MPYFAARWLCKRCYRVPDIRITIPRQHVYDFNCRRSEVNKGEQDFIANHVSKKNLLKSGTLSTFVLVDLFLGLTRLPWRLNKI